MSPDPLRPVSYAAICRVLLLLLALLGMCGSGRAEERVQFQSLDGPPPTLLDGYLFRAPGTGRHPALVFLHGCGGLFGHKGTIVARERDWAKRFNALGFTVLMVDGLGPRHHGEMCAHAHFDAAIYRMRSLDAYAALRYLQSQDFVRRDRIGLVGWSQGGGALLNAIRSGSRARPPALPGGDFRAAVAFYPGSCSQRRQPGGAWDSPVPLLVLIGDSDVWTAAEPCRALIETAAAGTQAHIHIYAGAYHDFDWPNLPLHRLPAFRTPTGVVPVAGTDEAARADAMQRVRAFFVRHLQGSE